MLSESTGNCRACGLRNVQAGAFLSNDLRVRRHD